MTPGFQKVAPKDRGVVPQRSKTAEERVVAADLFLMDRYETAYGDVSTVFVLPNGVGLAVAWEGNHHR